LGRYADLFILKKDNNGILYDPEEDEVNLRYRVGEDGRARIVF